MDRTHLCPQMVLLHCGIGLSPASLSPLLVDPPRRMDLSVCLAVASGWLCSSARNRRCPRLAGKRYYKCYAKCSLGSLQTSTDQFLRPTNCFSRLQRASDVPCCYGCSFLQGAGLRIKASRLSSTIGIIKPQDALGAGCNCMASTARNRVTALMTRAFDGRFGGDSGKTDSRDDLCKYLAELTIEFG